MAIIIDENNMYIRKGDSAIINLEFFQDGVDGEKTDITGSSIYLTVKVPADGVIILQKIVTSHEDPINGLSNIELLAADTDIEPRTYSYDIQITMPDGQVHTIYPIDPKIIGKFYVKKGIS